MSSIFNDTSYDQIDPPGTIKPKERKTNILVSKQTINKLTTTATTKTYHDTKYKQNHTHTQK